MKEFSIFHQYFGTIDAFIVVGHGRSLIKRSCKKHIEFRFLPNLYAMLRLFFLFAAEQQVGYQIPPLVVRQQIKKNPEHGIKGRPTAQSKLSANL